METAATDKYVQYRGELQAGLAQGHVLVFVTRHAEGQPTPLYRLDLDKAELSGDEFGASGLCVVADDSAVFVGASDSRIYRGPLGGGEIKPLGEAFESAPTALALLNNDRLAVLVASSVLVIDRAKGKVLQQLALPDKGTRLVSDKTGQWLVAGTERGVLVVFDGEDKPQLVISDSKKLHEGGIASLLFDPDEPRVYSAGFDNRLLLTHVRGDLEAEDRAGGAAHDGAVMAMCLGPEDKLYTAGRDAALKTWTRGPQKKRPSTLKEGVGKAVALVRVEFKGRPHLAVLCDDQTVRLFPLDAGGKVGPRTLTFHDVYGWAEHEFEQREVARREAALRQLAQLNDQKAIELLAERVSDDSDHGLKVLATDLLGQSGNPRAVKRLESFLTASNEQVRQAAFSGLLQLDTEHTLRPIELALQAQHRDVGVAAIEQLLERAKSDDQAMARLIKALDDDPTEVRAAALGALESLHPKDSAEPSLIALSRSEYADVRRLALVRLFQRKLLDEPQVQVALRRHEGDSSAEVRQAAFLVSVMSRPALAEALRNRDRDLHRLLWELESFGQKIDAQAEAPKPKKTKTTVAAEDMRPLLEAMASRALDTCLWGARGLASLQDERAFGTLLQLTNEKNAPARVDACKALAELGDPRGIQRLRQMLRDGSSEVRDAAFTALARLEEKAPLRAAEAGLLAPTEDTRGRGLQLLVRQIKKDAPAKASKTAPKFDPQAVALLERALNDSAASVRTEAFKAVLNLDIGRGDAATLRFALRSIQASVRHEVLSEVMGRIQEAWAPELLLDLLWDPEPSIRAEAFAFAQKRSKGKAIEPLAKALSGPHMDLKLKAIEELSKRRSEGVRALLVKALDDAEQKVRTAAVEALLVDEAEEPLRQAMKSSYADVRVRASVARAIAGDGESLEPLMAIVKEKEPELAEKRSVWVDQVSRALEGLGFLEAVEAHDTVADLVNHKEKQIRQAAASALGWVSRPVDDSQGSQGDLQPLKAALSHADDEVKRHSALGLALNGDASGIAIVKGLVEARGAAAKQGLAVCVALGSQAEDLVLAYLDNSDEGVRQRALLVTMLIEASEQDGVPDRCLAALSSSHPRVRLVAARALEAFAKAEEFESFVVGLFNDRGEDEAAWTVPAETVRTFAEVLAHGALHMKVRAVELLQALREKKQERFDREWRVFSKRYEKPIKALLTEAKKRKPAASQYAPEELARVVLGAYVGLSRQAGGSMEMRVRQTAISRLTEVAKKDPSVLESVFSVLLLAVGDNAQAVRKQAFESLQALGMDAAQLGAEALSTDYRDMGVAGLKLLAEGGAKKKAGQQILEQVMLQHTDGLEMEAAELLAESRGWVPVYQASLEAKSLAARQAAVNGLATQYDEHPEAAKALRQALGSRYSDVRNRAAIMLGQHKDAAAFESLVKMLRGEQQDEAIEALQVLGDKRTAQALMDRIDEDPAGDAMVDELLETAGSFRQLDSAERLFKYLEEKKTREQAFQALFNVSGYNQPILESTQDDALDDSYRHESKPAAGWEKLQHPRSETLLAKLLDAAYRFASTSMFEELIPCARWAPQNAEIDKALAPFGAFSDEDTRINAVRAMGFRLRTRGGPVDPIITALGHKDPKTQLYAAEALAMAGRADGMRVLLTTIDAMDDLECRRRAVRALGMLAHAGALDTLLRLANEEGHALQEDAAEAIGHLASSSKASAIEELLLRLAAGDGGIAMRALAGLRWFGSQKAWATIRSRIKDDSWRIRQKVAELLGFDSDPASREALIKCLENESDDDVTRAAIDSLRQLFGADSLEPDYAVLCSSLWEMPSEVMERLRTKGEPERLLSLLPKVQLASAHTVVPALVAMLLGRDPLPLDAALAHIESVHERAGEVAATIIGRAGKAVAKTHGKALVKATSKAAQAWKAARIQFEKDSSEADFMPQTSRYQRMLWACGRLEVGAEEVVAAALLPDDDIQARPLRWEALTALSSGYGKAEGLSALKQATASSDARLRQLGAYVVAKLEPKASAELVTQLLDDRGSLDQLLSGLGTGTKEVKPALRQAAANAHTQGVALPHLVASGDVEGLSQVLSDSKLTEAVRFGAIEALGRIATDAAIESLQKVARNKAEDEEICKAAWRAVRRARRYQKSNTTRREVSP